MVSHTIVQKITLHLYKLTLSTEQRFLSVTNNYTQLNFQLYSPKKIALYVSCNQHTIVCKDLDNPDAGLTGACTFQDEQIGQ